MPDTFAVSVLRRLPLAEAVLELWRGVADPDHLDALYDRERGRGYSRDLPFATLVGLIADALLEHGGSARRSFERGRASAELAVSNVAAYGKLGRLPPAVSEALLADGTGRLQAVAPLQPAAPVPPSVAGFAVTVVDGKVVKRVPKRLRPLRPVRGGVLGGKALVALDLARGLALAMAADPDGDANDARLVPALVPQVRARRAAVLWVADRQFCDLTQTALFAGRPGDHFVVRYHPRTAFCPDPAGSAGTGTDAAGRPYADDAGWLGAARNPARRRVRRITLPRPGADPLVLITDLTDPAEYPAADLLAVYQARWGIERVFQQITEVFDLAHLIGTTPRGTLFQLAFCLLLYNLIQVVRGYVAEGAQEATAAVSTELLFPDVRRQLIALHETLTPAEVLPLVPGGRPAGAVRERLRALLGAAWTERWRKAAAKPRHPPPARGHQRTHGSAYRILRADRLTRRAGPAGSRC